MVVALLGVSLMYAACDSGLDAPNEEEVRPVRTAVAGESAGSVDATYSGEIAARYVSKLGFQVSGRVIGRLVDVGSPVKRGQALMRLDPAQETLQMAAAAAEVEAAKSRAAQARIDLTRTEQLLGRQFASQAELEQQRLALSQAEAQLESALAQQQMRVNQRSYTELVADRDGVVTAIGAERGQVVSAGQAVVTVAANGEREVVVSIPESRVDELRRARSLQVSAWAHPGKTYRGALRELAPDADNVTRTYSARIAVKDPGDALRLGMTASVLAVDVEGRSVLRLPLSAIHHSDGTPTVWVVDPQSSRVSSRVVALGGAQDDTVRVTAGLLGDETVVTAGVTMLQAGQKVRSVAATGSRP
ncbi:efflux RND transporter periplasmic adaptor subunit [Piscinibacter sp.]|uniref:efflux RND transporter periplasmic adaptor subunit n=1 Tax=Piscinibacter sp. TaxID=1903157 RepID=UPI002CD9D494|nr:efflux RND transporter periplasmic adaptor subunit [Albitalea sp.]HUG26309.1 efflux RND transporter periplasmic adaptor subunit [Albitalea sp.]